MVARAIARQDVLLAFQPVISPHQPQEPAFYEGLIRILDETGCIIPARHFIPVVETTDLGREIDCLALEMAFYSLGRDPSLRLAINMSARSITHPQWRQVLERGLAADLTAAERLVLAGSLPPPTLFAAYVAGQAIWDLVARSEPSESIPGIVLAALSLVVMPGLAFAKRRVGRRMSSRTVVADSGQTMLCSYLSAILLFGLVANATLGWWWADPVAALVIAALAVREGREAWHGKVCCEPC